MNRRTSFAALLLVISVFRSGAQVSADENENTRHITVEQADWDRLQQIIIELENLRAEQGARIGSLETELEKIKTELAGAIGKSEELEQSLKKAEILIASAKDLISEALDDEVPGTLEGVTALINARNGLREQRDRFKKQRNIMIGVSVALGLTTAAAGGFAYYLAVQ